MAQNSLIQVRVDEGVKRDADALFSRLGFDTPTAIRMFLKQALLQHGLPFHVAEPQTDPQAHLPRKEGAPDIARMTKEQIDDMLQRSWDNMLAGNTKPASEVRESMKRKYNL